MAKSKCRHSWTYREAEVVLTSWLERKGWGQKELIRFLEAHGVTISPQTCSALVNGKITPGPKFKQVFREITGVQLQDGFVEVPK